MAAFCVHIALNVSRATNQESQTHESLTYFGEWGGEIKSVQKCHTVSLEEIALKLEHNRGTGFQTSGQCTEGSQEIPFCLCR